MINKEQIKLLQDYRDRAYVSSVLCSEANSYFSYIKQLINVPLILFNSAMTILNSSDFNPHDMKIPNVIINILTALIIGLIGNFKISEKEANFKQGEIKFNKLCHQIEDLLTNEINDISNDVIKNIINQYDNFTESIDFNYPNFIKKRVKIQYQDKKVLPNVINCTTTFLDKIPMTSSQIFKIPLQQSTSRKIIVPDNDKNIEIQID